MGGGARKIFMQKVVFELCLKGRKGPVNVVNFPPQTHSCVLFLSKILLPFF